MFNVPENNSNFLFSIEELYEIQLSLFNGTENDSVAFIEGCQPFSKFIQMLNMVYVPSIVLMGFVGNILSFLVLSMTHLKLRSSSYYLAALAVSDFGFLAVIFVIYCSLTEVFELFHEQGFCQFFTYLSSVCAFLSVWLTVAYTTERFIAVKYPLRRQYVCTVKRAKYIVLGIVLASLVSQLHVLWMSGLVLDGDRLVCGIKPHLVLIGKILNILDTFLTLIIPVALIVIMNITIARVVFQSQHHTNIRVEDQFISERIRCPVSSQSSDTTRNSDPEYSFSSRRVMNDNSLLRRNRHTRTTSLGTQQNINKMLLLVSTVFIALNLPSYVLRMLTFFNYDTRTPYIGCIQHVTMILFYTNFSINFLLYAMCGRSFRICMKKMFINFARKLYFW